MVQRPLDGSGYRRSSYGEWRRERWQVAKEAFWKGHAPAIVGGEVVVALATVVVSSVIGGWGAARLAGAVAVMVTALLAGGFLIVEVARAPNHLLEEERRKLHDEARSHEAAMAASMAARAVLEEEVARVRSLLAARIRNQQLADDLQHEWSWGLHNIVNGRYWSPEEFETWCGVRDSWLDRLRTIMEPNGCTIQEMSKVFELHTFPMDLFVHPDKEVNRAVNMESERLKRIRVIIDQHDTMQPREVPPGGLDEEMR